MFGANTRKESTGCLIFRACGLGPIDLLSCDAIARCFKIIERSASFQSVFSTFGRENDWITFYCHYICLIRHFRLFCGSMSVWNCFLLFHHGVYCYVWARYASQTHCSSHAPSQTKQNDQNISSTLLPSFAEWFSCLSIPLAHFVFRRLICKHWRGKMTNSQTV